MFLGNAQRLHNMALTYGQTFWVSADSHVAGSAFIIAYLYGRLSDSGFGKDGSPMELLEILSSTEREKG